MFIFLFFQWNDGWASEHAGAHKTAALQLFLCALVPSLFVFPGEADKALPGRPLTCLLITKGHPAGTHRWPLMPKVTQREEEEEEEEGEWELRLWTNLLRQPSLSFNLITHRGSTSSWTDTFVLQLIFLKSIINTKLIRFMSHYSVFPGWVFGI